MSARFEGPAPARNMAIRQHRVSLDSQLAIKSYFDAGDKNAI